MRYSITYEPIVITDWIFTLNNNLLFASSQLIIVDIKRVTGFFIVMIRTLNIHVTKSVMIINKINIQLGRRYEGDIIQNEKLPTTPTNVEKIDTLFFIHANTTDQPLSSHLS